MGQFRWQRGKKRTERQLDGLRQELSEQEATPSPPIRAPTTEELARSGPWLVWRRGQWVRDEPRHAPQRSASDDYEETGGSGHHQDRDLKMEPPKDEEVSAALDNTNVIPHNDVWNQDQLLPDDHDEHGEATSGNPPQSRLSPQYFLPSPHLIIQQVSMATEGITLGWTSTPYLFKYPAMGDLFTGTLTYQRNGKLFDIEGLDGCFNLEAIHARSRPIHDVLCGDMSTSSNDQELLIEAGNRRLRYRVNRTDMMFLIIMDTGIPLNVRWKSLRLLDDIIQNRWTNDISGDDTRNKGCEIIQRMADFEHDTITINDGISNVGNTCFAGALMQAYARSKIACEEYIRELENRSNSVYSVYPGGIIGPDAPELNEPHQALLIFTGPVAPMLGTGNQWIDARDIARVLLLIAEKRPRQRRFPLGGNTVPWREFSQTISALTGNSPLLIQLPGFMMRWIGSLVDLVRKFTPMDTPVSYEAMEFATRTPLIDNELTRQTFDFEFRDSRETVEDTLRWLHSTGHLTDKRAGKLCEY
jgi:hypothetical protein